MLPIGYPPPLKNHRSALDAHGAGNKKPAEAGSF